MLSRLLGLAALGRRDLIGLHSVSFATHTARRDHSLGLFFLSTCDFHHLLIDGHLLLGLLLIGIVLLIQVSFGKLGAISFAVPRLDAWLAFCRVLKFQLDWCRLLPSGC